MFGRGDSQKDRHVADGARASGRGDWTSAIAAYEAAAQLDPNDVRTFLKLGEIYPRVNDLQRTIQAFRSAADLYERQGFFLKAIAVYKQILKLEPEGVTTLECLVRLYECLGLEADAAVQLERIADIQERAGQLDAALATVDRAIRIAPIRPEPYDRAAALAMRLDRMAFAEQYRAAANLARTQAAAAAAEQAQAAHREALHHTRQRLVAALSKYLAVNPAHTEAVALILKLMEDGQGTPVPIDDLRADDPGDEHHCLTCGTLLGQRGAASAGAPAAERGDVAAVVGKLVAEAGVYLKYGLADRARRTYDAAAAMDPDNPEVAAYRQRTAHVEPSNAMGGVPAAGMALLVDEKPHDSALDGNDAADPSVPAANDDGTDDPGDEHHCPTCGTLLGQRGAASAEHGA